MVDTHTPNDTDSDTSVDAPVERPPPPESVQRTSSPDQNDDALTTSQNIRWEFLSTLTAGGTILSFLVLVLCAAFGVVTLSFTQPWFVLFSTAVITSYGWILGKDYINLGNDST